MAWGRSGKCYPLLSLLPPLPLFRSPETSGESGTRPLFSAARGSGGPWAEISVLRTQPLLKDLLWDPHPGDELKHYSCLVMSPGPGLFPRAGGHSLPTISEAPNFSLLHSHTHSLTYINSYALTHTHTHTHTHILAHMPEAQNLPQPCFLLLTHPVFVLLPAGPCTHYPVSHSYCLTFTCMHGHCCTDTLSHPCLTDNHCRVIHTLVPNS